MCAFFDLLDDSLEPPEYFGGDLQQNTIDTPTVHALWTRLHQPQLD